MANTALRLRRESGKVEPLKLTFGKRSLDAIKPPAEGQTWVYDDKLPGLALLALPSGAKRFYFGGRANGRFKRKALGAYPSVSIEAARKAAAKLAGEIAQGLDPFEIRKSAGKMTFGDLCKRWMEYANSHKLTAREDRRRIDKHLSKWKGRRVSSITRDEVAKLHRAIGAEAPHEANRALSLVKSMFNEAIEAEAITKNPARGVKKYAERPRERYLDRSELPRFLRALNQDSSTTARDFLWMTLLTAQRRGTVASMKWSDVDMKRRVWTVARTKRGGTHEVPLVDEHMKILTRRKAKNDLRDEPGEYVFEARGKGKFFSDPIPAIQRVADAACITSRLTPHDLRRTWATWANMASVPYGVVKKALDHSAGGDITIGVYAMVDIETLRRGYEVTTAAMMATLDDERGTDDGK